MTKLLLLLMRPKNLEMLSSYASVEDALAEEWDKN